jgi:AraC-like DNA-binding protein
MAIGWVILIAYVAFMVGFATSAIFSVMKIAILKHRLANMTPASYRQGGEE